MSVVVRHLSFARVVSVLAIFIALGAGAYAAGLKKNSVKGKQIKDASVATQDLKDQAVFGTKVADGSLTGADVTDGSLTGADLLESSLQTATAANADRVGGMEVKKVDFRSNIANGNVRSVVGFPNIFRIDAQCANVGDGLDITAFTAIDNSTIAMTGMTAPGADDQETLITDISSSVEPDLDANEAFAVDNNLPGGTSGFATNLVTIRFSTPTGFTARVDLQTVELPTRCVISGVAVGG